MKSANSVLRAYLGFISFVFFLASFFAQAIAQSSAGQKNYVFRTSNTQAAVRQLSIVTVPAYVLIDNVRHDGLYIVSVGGSQLASMMKLAPGQILLSLDGQKTLSASAAETYLARRGSRPFSFTYALMQGGKPFLAAGEIQDAASAAGSGSVSSRSQGQSTSSDSGSSNKQYTNAELQEYCLLLINQSRKAEGVAFVQQEASCTRLATKYANYMMEHAAHYEPTGTSTPHIDLSGKKPQDRAKDAGFSTVVLENIGRSTRGSFVSDKTIVKDLHDMMMAEPKGQINHRSTIVDPKCRYLGVGIARSSDRFYLVEEFSY